MLAKIISKDRLPRGAAVSLSISAVMTAREIATGVREDNPEKVAGAGGALIGGILGDVVTGFLTGTVLGVETGPGAVITGLIGGIIFGMIGRQAAEQHLASAARYIMDAAKQVTQPAAALPLTASLPAASTEQPPLPDHKKVKPPRKRGQLYVVPRKEPLHPEDVTTPIRSRFVSRYDVPTRSNIYKMAM